MVRNLPRWSFSHEIVGLALSPDAEWVACALEPNQVLIWSVAKERVVHRLDVGAIRVPVGAAKTARIEFAGGHRYLAVVHFDRYLVFDLSSSERILDLPVDGLSLSGFFVGEGGVVAFSGTEGRPGQMPVTVFDLYERREMAQLDVSSLGMGVPFAVMLSSDHRRVVTWHVSVASAVDSGGTSGFRGRLAIWQTKSGDLLEDFEIPVLTEPRGMGFDGEGRIWGVSGGERFLWDPVTGRELERFEVPEGGHVLADGRLFAAKEGALHRIESEAEGPVRVARGLPKKVVQMAAARLAPRVAILGDTQEGGGHFIELWDSETGIRAREVAWPVVPSRSVSISPDGQHMASGSIDGIVRLWTVEQGRLARERTMGRTIGALVFWGSQRLAVVTEDQLLVWDLSTGDVRPLTTLEPSLWDVQGRHRPLGQFSTFSTERLALSDDRRLAYARGASLFLWAEDETPIEIPGGPLDSASDRRSSEDGPRVWHVGDTSVGFGDREVVLRNAELSADGQWLAVAHSRRSVILRDLKEGRDVHQIHFDEDDAFRRVRLHPDRRRVVLDPQLPFNGLKVFDLETGETQFEVAPLDRFGNIGAFELSRDGRFLWVGDARSGTLRQVDMVTGAELGKTSPEPTLEPNHSVEALATSSDDTLLAVAYDDGSIRLWRVHEEELTLQHLYLGGRDGNWLSCASDADCQWQDDGTLVQRLSPEGRFSPIGPTKGTKEEIVAAPATDGVPSTDVVPSADGTPSTGSIPSTDDGPPVDPDRPWTLWVLGAVFVLLVIALYWLWARRSSPRSS